MATIIQTTSTPMPSRYSGLGDGIGELSKALFGQNEAQQTLLREKAREAEQLNADRAAYKAALEQKWSSLSPGQQAALGFGAGLSGSDIGGHNLYIAANTYGAADPHTTKAQLAAGQGIGGTYLGHKMVQDTSRANNAATLAEQRRESGMYPTGVTGDNGQSVFVPRKDAYGRGVPENIGTVQGNVARRNIDPTTGQLRPDMNAPTQRFIGADPKGGTTPEVIQLQNARDALPPDDPRRKEIDAIIRAKSISAGGEGTYDKKTAEHYANIDTRIQEDAGRVPQRKALLDHIDALIRSGKVFTGPNSQYVLALQQFGRMMGIPGIESTASTELVRALGNKMMLDLAPNGSLGGNISNGDRDVLAQTVPGMTNTPEGNLALIGVLSRIEDRKLDINRWRAEYAAANGGRVDGGFTTFLAQRAEQNPLFSQRNSGGGIRPGHVEDGYEFLGGDPSSPRSWRRAR